MKATRVCDSKADKGRCWSTTPIIECAVLVARATMNGESQRCDSYARVGWLEVKSGQGQPPPVRSSAQGDGGHSAGPPWQGRPSGNFEGDSTERGSGGETTELMTYAVIYEQGPTSWGAYVPDLPGVISVGESRDEVERSIREAIEFHVEGMREEGLAIPAPSSFAGEVEVTSIVPA